MEVNHDVIAHLAELSNFAVIDQESAHLTSDLKGIISYISQLDELDTNGVEPTYQVFEMENIWRPDEIMKQDASPDELLSLTETVEKHQIKVPKVL